MLEAAFLMGFYLFLLAFEWLSLYSARRARFVLLSSADAPATFNSEEEKETRWQNH